MKPLHDEIVGCLSIIDILVKISFQVLEEQIFLLLDQRGHIYHIVLLVHLLHWFMIFRILSLWNHTMVILFALLNMTLLLLLCYHLVWQVYVVFILDRFLTHANVFIRLWRLLLKPTITSLFINFLRHLNLIGGVCWFWRQFFEFGTQLFVLIFKQILYLLRLVFVDDVEVSSIFLHFLTCRILQNRVIILINDLILIRRWTLVGRLFHLC